MRIDRVVLVDEILMFIDRKIPLGWMDGWVLFRWMDGTFCVNERIGCVDGWNDKREGWRQFTSGIDRWMGYDGWVNGTGSYTVLMDRWYFEGRLMDEWTDGCHVRINGCMRDMEF